MCTRTPEPLAQRSSPSHAPTSHNGEPPRHSEMRFSAAHYPCCTGLSSRQSPLHNRQINAAYAVDHIAFSAPVSTKTNWARADNFPRKNQVPGHPFLRGPWYPQRNGFLGNMRRHRRRHRRRHQRQIRRHKSAMRRRKRAWKRLLKRRKRIARRRGAWPGRRSGKTQKSR